MVDDTDRAIIALLAENSRRQWKEIGAKVHLTGQAVAARVQALEDAGLITGYTVKTDAAKLGRPLRAFITVFMTSANHTAFRQFVAGEPAITTVHRIGGEGCYWLQADLADHNDLDTLLEKILRHGNYRLQLSISPIK